MHIDERKNQEKLAKWFFLTKSGLNLRIEEMLTTFNVLLSFIVKMLKTLIQFRNYFFTKLFLSFYLIK